MKSKTKKGLKILILSNVVTCALAGPFDNEIERYSSEYNVDKYLIESVIKVESAYKKLAVSNKGAKGLMQLMDPTAKHYGVKDSFNVSENIMGGTRYLVDLIKRYKKIDLVLAAYNAGETAVNKYNGIPPYKETQNYVKKVKSVYKGLTGETLALKKKESSFKSAAAFSNPAEFSGFQSSFQSVN